MRNASSRAGDRNRVISSRSGWVHGDGQRRGAGAGRGDRGLAEADVDAAGWPLAVSAMGALKPPETVVVSVELPLAPCATVTAVDGAVSVKSGGGAGAVTVSETAAV